MLTSVETWKIQRPQNFRRLKMNTKDKENKTGPAGFASACEGFQGMFEKMAKCCPDKDGFTDCSGVMDGIKEMMEMCCGPKTDSTTKDRAKC
jgi:hypothetical protein